jgi:S1-C subfamily serine protease
VFSEEDVSLLGLDILTRYVVTFDFPHQAIYLKKGRQFDRTIRYDRSGLWVRRVKGQTGVASVTDGSAAAKAGILPGDVLLQIDREQIKDMTLFTLRDRLCEEGKKIHLTIRRGEKQMDVPVVLSSDK